MDEPERVEVLLLSPEYFSILGARPALGRVFSKAEDDHPGIAEVVVISDAIWARRFSRSPDVLGRTLRIDGDSFKIVGVLPPSFRHPGRTLRGDVEMWAPAGYRSDPFPPPNRRGYFLAGSIARLKPGVTVSDAAAPSTVGVACHRIALQRTCHGSCDDRDRRRPPRRHCDRCDHCAGAARGARGSGDRPAR